TDAVDRPVLVDKIWREGLRPLHLFDIYTLFECLNQYRIVNGRSRVSLTLWRFSVNPPQKANTGTDHVAHRRARGFRFRTTPLQRHDAGLRWRDWCRDPRGIHLK